jgi:hypothetical protein
MRVELQSRRDCAEVVPSELGLGLWEARYLRKASMSGEVTRFGARVARLPVRGPASLVMVWCARPRGLGVDLSVALEFLEPPEIAPEVSEESFLLEGNLITGTPFDLIRVSKGDSWAILEDAQFLTLSVEVGMLGISKYVIGERIGQL